MLFNKFFDNMKLSKKYRLCKMEKVENFKLKGRKASKGSWSFNKKEILINDYIHHLHGVKFIKNIEEDYE